MQDVNIAPMTDADLEEVSALLRSCFNWLAKEEGFTQAQRAFLTGERSSKETVRDESETRPHLVAKDERGTLLGMAAVRGNELARLYVDPQFHGQRVGSRLFDAAERLIRHAGFTEMRVAALVESAAAFYRARGMREIGREIYEPEIFLGREVVLLAKAL
ncbi:MAG TPA: GNAT family N-acetyltransferase [Lacipirellulaceae bacterium]|jgi:GNAT superfamily N-acetyltransferase|nr:GNAT family N-acetyltransferase [Lacipirellulaceae bacterium]